MHTTTVEWVCGRAHRKVLLRPHNRIHSTQTATICEMATYRCQKPFEFIALSLLLARFGVLYTLCAPEWSISYSDTLNRRTRETEDFRRTTHSMCYSTAKLSALGTHTHTHTYPAICYECERACSLMDPQAKLIAHDDGDGDSWRPLAYLRHAPALTAGRAFGRSNRSTNASCCQDYNKFTQTHICVISESLCVRLCVRACMPHITLCIHHTSE